MCYFSPKPLLTVLNLQYIIYKVRNGNIGVFFSFNYILVLVLLCHNWK